MLNELKEIAQAKGIPYVELDLENEAKNKVTTIQGTYYETYD